MDDENEVLVEGSKEKTDLLTQYKEPVDPDLIDKGFTCDSNKKKKFFVDDTEEQNVTKLPQVWTTLCNV